MLGKFFRGAHEALGEAGWYWLSWMPFLSKQGVVVGTTVIVRRRIPWSKACEETDSTPWIQLLLTSHFNASARRQTPQAIAWLIGWRFLARSGMRCRFAARHEPGDRQLLR